MTRIEPSCGLRFAIAAATLGLLASSALAHDDDPKILDRKPPVPGSGFVRGDARGARLPGGGFNPSASAMRGSFDSHGVVLQSWLTFADLGVGTANGNDCWGYTSPSGREYAIMCTTTNTVIVEITNPASPTIVASVDGPNSTWRDAKTYESYVYIVSEGGGGIQVVDLSNVDAGQVTTLSSVTTGGATSTHNVALNEDSGYLYRCGGANNTGLRIYDLANPAAPLYVAQWSDRYVHDAQIVSYTSGPLAGRELAFCCSGLNNGGTDTGLTVLDVTDKANIVVLSQLPYPSRAYSHQGWLSGDRTVFYLGDELDENGAIFTRTHMFDVSDPANTSYIGAFENGEVAIGHNMYEKDGLLYQANYTSGLRVFDVATNPTSPSEIAYFDSNPTQSGASFNGLWSCFPYFASGTVIGSDIERGLFVWSIDFAQIDIQVVGGPPAILSPAGTTIDVIITEGAPGDLVLGSETLWYDDGTGFTSVALANVGPGMYRGTFPALPCGTNVAWYLAASSPAGTEFTAPAGAPVEAYTSLVAVAVNTVRSDPMDTDAGWVGGQPGDTATTGQWVRVDPNGTAAQPEDDHTVAGTHCWVTGQGNPGGQVGAADVDGGFTTLVTPILDLSGLVSPILSYWRWYSNDQGGAAGSDTFNVEISNDGGATWSTLEIVGPTGPGTEGGWFRAEFDVDQHVVPTAQVRVRFIASDFGQGSIVEAAIDDFQIVDIECGGGIGTQYCTAVPNSTGNVGMIDASGSNSIASNDLVLTARDLPQHAAGYFVTAPTSGFVPNAGGSTGNLCVGSPIGRYVGQLGNSGASGTLTLIVDALQMPLPVGTTPVQPGETWYFQCWHRDLLVGIVTSNFTRGYAVTFQ